MMWLKKELSAKFGLNWRLCSASAVKVDRPWAAAAYAAAKFKISDTHRRVGSNFWGCSSVFWAYNLQQSPARSLG